MADTRGVFTPAADTAWKLIVLLLVVAGAGFEAAQYLRGGAAQAAVVAASPAPLTTGDIVQRLDRIEQSQTTMQLDVAVIKSQVADLRGGRR